MRAYRPMTNHNDKNTPVELLDQELAWVYASPEVIWAQLRDVSGLEVRKEIIRCSAPEIFALRIDGPGGSTADPQSIVRVQSDGHGGSLVTSWQHNNGQRLWQEVIGQLTVKHRARRTLQSLVQAFGGRIMNAA